MAIESNLEYLDLCRERRQVQAERDRATERLGEIDERIAEIEAEQEAIDDE